MTRFLEIRREHALSVTRIERDYLGRGIFKFSDCRRCGRFWLSAGALWGFRDKDCVCLNVEGEHLLGQASGCVCLQELVPDMKAGINRCS